MLLLLSASSSALSLSLSLSHTHCWVTWANKNEEPQHFNILGYCILWLFPLFFLRYYSVLPWPLTLWFACYLQLSSVPPQLEMEVWIKLTGPLKQWFPQPRNVTIKILGHRFNCPGSQGRTKCQAVAETFKTTQIELLHSDILDSVAGFNHEFWNIYAPTEGEKTK